MSSEEIKKHVAIHNLIRLTPGGCTQRVGEVTWIIFKNQGCILDSLEGKIKASKKTIEKYVRKAERAGLIDKGRPYPGKGPGIPLYATLYAKEIMTKGAFVPSDDASHVAIGLFIKDEETNKRLFWFRKTPPLQNRWGIFFILLQSREYDEIKNTPVEIKRKFEEVLGIEIKNDLLMIYNQPAEAMRRSGVPAQSFVVYDVKRADVIGEPGIDYINYVACAYFTRDEYISEKPHSLLMEKRSGKYAHVCDKRIDDLVEVLKAGKKLEEKGWDLNEYIGRAIMW